MFRKCYTNKERFESNRKKAVFYNTLEKTEIVVINGKVFYVLVCYKN